MLQCFHEVTLQITKTHRHIHGLARVTHRSNPLVQFCNQNQFIVSVNTVICDSKVMHLAVNTILKQNLLWAVITHC